MSKTNKNTCHLSGKAGNLSSCWRPGGNHLNGKSI